MTTFVTHPSVRIRGTENNYNPSQCLDPNCNNKSPHMHCPFCIKTECYLDPVILKAHYRVKHVDKGLDFAGLKILRCCDHCDIVGAIKGEKKFKGAHWHCYKCKNGFNRRDEAIKHYKTHFRNPQTTFQIQITQEVNQSSQLYESQEATHIISQDSLAAATTTIHPVLTEAIMTAASSNNGMNNENDSSLANGKGEGEVSVTVAANETVASTEGHAIMIIHEEQLENAHDVESNTFSATLTNNEGLQITSLLDVKMQLENRLVELQHQNQQLQIEKSQTEQQLQKEVEQLKLQIQMQANEISSLQKRQRELLEQLTIPVDDHLRQMLTNMQAQHQELLHQQLAQLKRNCLQKTHLFTQGNIALQVTSQPLTSMTGDSVVVTSPDNNGHLIPIPLQLMTDASVLVGNSENISASNNVSKDNPSRSLKRTSDDSNSNSRKRSKL